MNINVTHFLNQKNIRINKPKRSLSTLKSDSNYFSHDNAIQKSSTKIKVQRKVSISQLLKSHGDQRKSILCLEKNYKIPLKICKDEGLMSFQDNDRQQIPEKKNLPDFLKRSIQNSRTISTSKNESYSPQMSEFLKRKPNQKISNFYQNNNYRRKNDSLEKQSIKKQEEPYRKNLCLNSFKGNWFDFHNQFSLIIPSEFVKNSIEIQTENYSVQDKYFYDYAKYRNQRVQDFQQIQKKQKIFHGFLTQSELFKKNYQDLIKYTSEKPQNQREKRVHGLSSELQECQNEVQRAFKQIIVSKEEFQDNIKYKFNQFNDKRRSLLISTSHLINVVLSNNKKQQSKKVKSQTQRILSRILNQLRHLNGLESSKEYLSINFIFKFYNQLSNLKDSYQKWQSLLMQNRILIYNFMKQIQKTPAIAISLLGLGQENDSMKTWNEEQHFKSRLDQYLSSQCQECYHMKRKIKFLQFNNSQLKPILKSMQWLVRSQNKSRNCLEMI